MAIDRSSSQPDGRPPERRPGDGPAASTWMRWFLRAAGTYSLLWALVALGDPIRFCTWGGVAYPGRPELPQALGMLIGVLGIGSWLASFDPMTHWIPVALVLMSKTLAGLGGLGALSTGAMPSSAWWVPVVNDLFWVPGLALILHRAYDQRVNRRRTLSSEVLRMALRSKTQFGVSLDELSRLSPVLLVFLRHAGCPFCREAMKDLAANRQVIADAGARLVLVHMGTEAQGERFFAKYGLQSVARIADPKRSLYRAFGLSRAGLMLIVGPRVWWRAFESVILGRNGIGRFAGDVFQMPGVFLLFHGEVLRSYRHRYSSDRPDYVALVQGSNYAEPEFHA